MKKLSKGTLNRLSKVVSGARGVNLDVVQRPDDSCIIFRDKDQPRCVAIYLTDYMGPLDVVSEDCLVSCVSTLALNRDMDIWTMFDEFEHEGVKKLRIGHCEVPEYIFDYDDEWYWNTKLDGINKKQKAAEEEFEKLSKEVIRNDCIWINKKYSRIDVFTLYRPRTYDCYSEIYYFEECQEHPDDNCDYHDIYFARFNTKYANGIFSRIANTPIVIWDKRNDNEPVNFEYIIVNEDNCTIDVNHTLPNQCVYERQGDFEGELIRIKSDKSITINFYEGNNSEINNIKKIDKKPDVNNKYIIE